MLRQDELSEKRKLDCMLRTGCSSPKILSEAEHRYCESYDGRLRLEIRYHSAIKIADGEAHKYLQFKGGLET